MKAGNTAPEPIFTDLMSDTQSSNGQTNGNGFQAARNRYSCAGLNEGRILLAGDDVQNLKAAERLRMLRAKIERHNLGEKRYHVFSITSALPQEGKSVVSSNLARAFGLDPLSKTLLIDCDLRRPSVHKFFGLPQTPGLSDALLAEIPLKSVIRSIDPGLDVLTAGSPTDDATQTIELPIFARYLLELKKRYRYIIMDCPPVLLCPEPITLSTLSESTIMVARAWRTERKLVEEATRVIGRKNIMGMVVNDGLDPSKQYSYYSYYGYRTNLASPPPTGVAKKGLLIFLGKCYSLARGLFNAVPNKIFSKLRRKKD